MKRTEKSKANNRQKSKANGRQDKSIASSSQSKPKDCDRDKVKYDAKHITVESCSQPVPKHPRTDADVQQVQHELKLGEMFKTIPTINFNVETVEYKNQSFTVQKDTEVIHREVKGGTKINLYLNQSEFSEKRRLKDSVKKHSERKTSRLLRNSDSESPEDRDHTGQSLNQRCDEVAE